MTSSLSQKYLIQTIGSQSISFIVKYSKRYFFWDLMCALTRNIYVSDVVKTVFFKWVTWYIKKVPSVTILNLLIKQFIFVWRLYEDFLRHSNLWFSRLTVTVFLIFMFLKLYHLFIFANNPNRNIFCFPFLSMSGHIYKYFCMIGINVLDINIDRWWRWNLFCHIFMYEKNPWFQEYLTFQRFVTYLKVNNGWLITISLIFSRPMCIYWFDFFIRNNIISKVQENTDTF